MTEPSEILVGPGWIIESDKGLTMIFPEEMETHFGRFDLEAERRREAILVRSEQRKLSAIFFATAISLALLVAAVIVRWA